MNLPSQQILVNITKFLPSWGVLSPEDLSITSLAGLTNITLKIKVIETCEKYKEITPNILIYRHFCSSPEFINPETERLVFETLSLAGIGPQTYGYCSEFRLEEFINGTHPNRVDMASSKMIRALAEPIAKIHLLNVDLDKVPIMKKFLENEENIVRAKGIFDLNGNKDSRIDILREILCKSEAEFMLKEEKGKGVTFCHNDLNPTNIFLVNNEKIEFKFIDGEYAGYNYRGFDIASIFIEISFNYDDFPKYFFTPELFAKENNIREFCEFYLFFQKQQLLNEQKFKREEIFACDLKEENIAKLCDVKLFREEVEELVNILYIIIYFVFFHTLFFFNIFCDSSKYLFLKNFFLFLLDKRS